MRALLKKSVSVILILALLFASDCLSAKGATTTKNVPIAAYTLNGKVDTFQSVNGSYSGYIAAGDQCSILEIYDSGWVKVKYPVSNGYKTAYTKSEYFFNNINFMTSTIQLGKKMTVYTHSDLSAKLGTVYAKDNVIVVSNNGTNTQIIYPVSKGYKMGWVKGIYYHKSDGMETTVADGYYQIKSAIDTKYVLDIYGANTGNGANVQIYQNTKGQNQGFYIKHQGNGYYTIEAIHSNKVLDVYKGWKDSGTNIIQYESNGADNQLWKIYKTKDGYYRFQSKSSGLFLDVNGAVAANETNVQIWRNNGTAAQKFSLVSVTRDMKEGHDPEGCLDSIVSDADNQITIKGWVFDRDDLNAAVQVHVYVGGPAGVGEGCMTTADVYRPDVNNVYPGVGDNHGFLATFDVKATGDQEVYVYAINVGADTGNPLIGTKRVTIKGSTENNTGFQMPMNDASCTWGSGYGDMSWNAKKWWNLGAGRDYHLALDIVGSSDDVYAFGDGKVVASGWNGANGNYIIIQHTVSGKVVYSFYAHLDSRSVSANTDVTKGQKIGVVGKTGNAANGLIHLHFSVVDTLWSNGGYYGYSTSFTGDVKKYEGVTYYNPLYIIRNGKLP